MSSQLASSSVRNRAACDICRSRKVKCTALSDTIGCDGCKFLGVECTRIKPRRKRGPPNRHVQRQRSETHTAIHSSESAESGQALCTIENQTSLLDSHASSPPKTYETGSQVPAFTRGSEILAELGPVITITKILDDWFDYLHPLCPILHRRRIKARLNDGEANRNPVFLAVLISTCAATTALLRHKASREYSSITVVKCLELINSNGLLRPDIYSLDWCIAQYNISSALMPNSKLTNMALFRALTNATTGVQWLIGYGSQSLPLYDLEMLKRLYGLLLVWQFGADTRGQPYLVFHPFHVELDQLRPKDITDNELDQDLRVSSRDEGPEDGGVRYIPGFNANVDLFLVWQSARLDVLHKSPDEVLKRGFDRIQTILDSLPPALRWRGGLSRVPETTWGHEMQMFNLLINSLYMKSALLQHLGRIESNYSHKVIISDLLEVCDHLPRSMLEASGFVLEIKMRDIGAAYLEELRMSSKGDMVDPSSDPQLKSLLDHLAALDAEREVGSSSGFTWKDSSSISQQARE